LRGAALRHDVPGTTFALAALGGDTQFQLDIAKAHACTHMAGNIAVRYSLAYTDDHGGKQIGWR
jgi:hypothetical protein